MKPAGDINDLTEVQDLLPTPKRTLVVVGALHLCGPGNLEECLGVAWRPMVVLNAVPWLRQWPASLLGVGMRPEQVRSAEDP